MFLFWGRFLWRNSLFDVEGQFYLYLVSVDRTGRQMDVLVIVVIAPRPEDVDRLKDEMMHNSGGCCGSGRTCYRAGQMNKALRTGMGFRQAQREKGSSPTLDVNGCCCSFVWVGRCVGSQVPNWPRPTFVAIEPKKKLRIPGSLSLSSTGRESKRRGQEELDPDRVQPLDCHFWPTHSIPGWRTDRYF